ncbi:hypothetical protein MTO96_001732 [Rhipicephalus appendiculatus]
MVRKTVSTREPARHYANHKRTPTTTSFGVRCAMQDPRRTAERPLVGCEQVCTPSILASDDDERSRVQPPQQRQAAGTGPRLVSERRRPLFDVTLTSRPRLSGA